MEHMDQEPKISLPEIIIITPYIIATDLAGLALAFFGLTDFGLISLIRFPITQIYLRIKGVKGTANVASNAIEFLPYVNALPAATMGWIITIYLDRNPDKEALLNVATGKNKKTKNVGSGREREVPKRATSASSGQATISNPQPQKELISA